MNVKLDKKSEITYPVHKFALKVRASYAEQC